MRKLDFHIDEPVIHDAVIEKKKDFSQVLAGVTAGQSAGATNLSVVWVAGACVVGLVVSSLAFFAPGGDHKGYGYVAEQPGVESETGLVAEHVEEDMVTTTSTHPAIDNKLDDLALSGEDAVIVDEEPVAMVMTVKEPEPEVAPQPKPITERINLAPISVRNPEAIPTQHEVPVKSWGSRIPRGLPIHVDFPTYVELKRANDYYIEIDTAVTPYTSAILREDWDEALLTRYKSKGKYRLTLMRGEQSLDVIVDIVVDHHDKDKKKSSLLR